VHFKPVVPRQLLFVELGLVVDELASESSDFLLFRHQAHQAVHPNLSRKFGILVSGQLTPGMKSWEEY
jgi:hypothetical protein